MALTEEEKKERRRATLKKYKETHKEKLDAYNKEYRKKYYWEHKEENREKKNAYMRERYRKDPERFKEYGKKRYEEKKDTILEQQKEYRDAHKEEIKAYKEKNKERTSKYNKEYSKTPVARAHNLLSSYRQRDKAYNRGECTLTAEWIITNIFNQPCTYCHQDVGWEHIGCDRKDNALPHTPENCVPCCLSCNSKKGNMSYDEYMKKVRNES